MHSAGMLPNAGVRSTFTSPVLLAITFVPPVVLHLLLFRAKEIQHTWHRVLEFLRMRSRNLPECRLETKIIVANPRSADMPEWVRQRIQAGCRRR